MRPAIPFVKPVAEVKSHLYSIIQIYKGKLYSFESRDEGKMLLVPRENLACVAMAMMKGDVFSR